MGNLRLVAGENDDVGIQGFVPKGFKSCKVSAQVYQKNVALLLSEVRKRIPEIRISTLDTGTVEKSPVLENFHRKLALASLNDAAMDKIRREGEKQITLNQVFDGLVVREKLFDEFIRIHREMGLNLNFQGVEKVFRDRVVSSVYRDQLLAAGGKPSDVIISGAGIYRFAVTNLGEASLATSHE